VERATNECSCCLKTSVFQVLLDSVSQGISVHVPSYFESKSLDADCKRFTQ
jgi:hypothetical protein